MNIGNPHEMTIEEIAETIIRMTGSHEPDRLPAAARGRSEGAPARHHARPHAARLGAEGGARGGPRPRRSSTSGKKVSACQPDPAASATVASSSPTRLTDGLKPRARLRRAWSSPLAWIVVERRHHRHHREPRQKRRTPATAAQVVDTAA